MGTEVDIRQLACTAQHGHELSLELSTIANDGQYIRFDLPTCATCGQRAPDGSYYKIYYSLPTQNIRYIVDIVKSEPLT